jgi:hypothetical protein
MMAITLQGRSRHGIVPAIATSWLLNGFAVEKGENMNNFSSRTGWLAVALTIMIAALVGQPAVAKDDTNHPLRILKAKVDTDGRSGFNPGGRGSLSIWIKNAADVTVDGITVTVELYNDRRRKMNTLTKDIDALDAGEKRIVTFEWDEFEEVKPKYFVEYYSRGKQKTKFEGDQPDYS